MRKRGAALSNRLLEHAFRQGRGHLGRDGERSCALAEDGHIPGISSKSCDVVVYPLQRGKLIEQSIIARGVMAGLLRQFGMDEESEDAEPIVHGNDDHALLREVGT